MATNEVVERNDIWLMDRDELQEHLMEAGFSEESSSIIKGIKVASSNINKGSYLRGIVWCISTCI